MLWFSTCNGLFQRLLSLLNNSNKNKKNMFFQADANRRCPKKKNNTTLDLLQNSKKAEM